MIPVLKIVYKDKIEHQIPVPTKAVPIALIFCFSTVIPAIYGYVLVSIVLQAFYLAILTILSSMNSVVATDAATIYKEDENGL